MLYIRIIARWSVSWETAFSIYTGKPSENRTEGFSYQTTLNTIYLAFSCNTSIVAAKVDNGQKLLQVIMTSWLLSKYRY